MNWQRYNTPQRTTAHLGTINRPLTSKGILFMLTSTSLGAKISLGYGTLIALTAALGGVGMYQMSAVRGNPA